MQKLKNTLFIITLLCLANSADIRLNMGFGTMGPDNDPEVKAHLGRDFAFNGGFGVIHDNNIETRWDLVLGNMDPANPKDDDFNLSASLFGLRLAGMYHFNKTGSFDPYLGLGYDLYAYQLFDDYYGKLKSGGFTGPVGIIGFDYKLLEGLYFNCNYSKTHLPKTFFGDSNNFDVNTWTFGFSIRGEASFRTTSSTGISSTEYEKPVMLPPVPTKKPVKIILGGDPEEKNKEHPVEDFETLKQERDKEKAEKEKLAKELKEIKDKEEKEKENNKYKEKHPDQVPPGWDAEKHSSENVKDKDNSKKD